jgi:hypothetical protein
VREGGGWGGGGIGISFPGSNTHGKQTCERGRGGGGGEGRQDTRPRTKVPYAQAELPYSTSIPPCFFYSKALMEIFLVYSEA